MEFKLQTGLNASDRCEDHTESNKRRELQGLHGRATHGSAPMLANVANLGRRYEKATDVLLVE